MIRDISGFEDFIQDLPRFLFSLIGGATYRRATAEGITAGILVAGWLFNAIQQLAAVLEWTRFISLFWYYNGNNILLNGMIGWHALVLIGTGAVSVATGTYIFQRRDLR